MTERTRASITFLLTLGLFAFCLQVRAQQKPVQEWIIESLHKGGTAPEAGVEYDFRTQIATITNGAFVKFGEAVLTAERAALNYGSGDIIADGSVRIQQGEQVWASEHVRYNFFTHQLEAEQFRTGETPVFATGAGVHGDITNHVYYATNAVVTTDDIAQPAFKIRARRIKIIPGKKIVAYDAVLYAEGVPVFYFPYYTRNIGEHANNWNFLPGYRTLFGPFILGNYTWYIDEHLNTVVHLDYRAKRGPGGGPDVNFDFGPWGQGTFKYYYTHDRDPEADQLGFPISEDRQRVVFAYQANPATNLYIKSLVQYQSDPAVVRDFFEGEYRTHPQPKTFFDANKFWQNWSLDAYVQPQVNNFLETVERLPDIRLTGFRQQVGETPVYYQSETSAGYYRRVFADNLGTNGAPSAPGLAFEAARADTYHQLVVPETLFGWLNLTPRVGGRFTYYGEASGTGATTDEETRGVFNTGAEVSFKASRVWPTARNSLFEVNGLRHIIEPSANYVYVPSPTTPPSQLPQFDYELPSLRLLPNEFPDFNDIDAIDSQNVIRWGVRNKLQTKREGQIVNLVNWDVYTDWRLKPNAGQTTFSDAYSDLALKPWSWLGVESLIRYDINDELLRMSYTTLTIQPGTDWSWRFGQYYLRHDLSGTPTAVGAGNKVLTSTLYYRMNENWGLRMAHYFNQESGKLQEQSYTIYRDLRSWTAALSFLIRDNTTGPLDYTVAFTFSLKAYPHFPLGVDTTGPYSLLGR
jgi:lipopolysaccharide assembly outer membrane protein LptD (OstA)